MSFIKSHSMQGSNYSYITCIVCSTKLPCSAEHWRAANAFTAQARRKEFCWVGLWKKSLLLSSPSVLMSGLEAWGLMLSGLQEVWMWQEGALLSILPPLHCLGKISGAVLEGWERFLWRFGSILNHIYEKTCRDCFASRSKHHSLIPSLFKLYECCIALVLSLAPVKRHFCDAAHASNTSSVDAQWTHICWMKPVTSQ